MAVCFPARECLWHYFECQRITNHRAHKFLPPLQLPLIHSKLKSYGLERVDGNRDWTFLLFKETSRLFCSQAFSNENTDFTFPAFCERFVDFTVKFCFPCMEIHFTTSGAWFKIDSGVISFNREPNKNPFRSILFIIISKTNRLHVTERMLSNRAQKTPKYGENVNINDTFACGFVYHFLFLPCLDVICDILLNRRSAAWNLSILSIYEIFSLNRLPQKIYLCHDKACFCGVKDFARDL